MSGSLPPVVVTSAGAQPQTPAALRAQVVALATAAAPGLSANLPGSLIEDITSTDVGAVALCDSAWVELVNSLAPGSSNEYLLVQLANIYLGAGKNQGAATTTSVFVTFSGATGFVIPIGFTVSDGTYQYVVQDGGVIDAGGSTPPLFCVSTTLSGSWTVSVGTVTQLVTSVPSSVSPTITCTNLTAGTPSSGPESTDDFRVRVVQAGLVTSQGTIPYLKTLLDQIPGVQARLVSVRQVLATTTTIGGWEVICGGGDPYAVANAIYNALFDVTTLIGSMLLVTGITQASPGVVTTNLNHGYSNGQTAEITGIVGMTALNGVSFTVTVLSQTTFSIGINTSGYGAWISGGLVTPNLRNEIVDINDYPDTYAIPFVVPPLQTVTMTVLWGTTALNFVSVAAVASAAGPALVNYINTIAVGAPINVFDMQSIFQAAVVALVPTASLSRMVFEVSINGIGVAPQTGTGLIIGDPESYFYTNPSGSGILIMQG